ncbi:MAG: hypothetical protein WBG01_10125 [Bacteroidota bacterium]
MSHRPLFGRLSSRLEHDSSIAIGVLVKVDRDARRLGLAERAVQETCYRKLRGAGIVTLPLREKPGSALGVEVQMEPDGTWMLNLAFHRVLDYRSAGSPMPEGSGEWRLTVFTRAESRQAIEEELQGLMLDFVRQYLEAN